MEPRNVYLSGICVEEQSYRAGISQPIVTRPLLTHDLNRMTDALTGGLVVQGDRRTPNSFGYKVYRVNYPQGESWHSSEYSENYWNREHRSGFVGFYPYYAEEPPLFKGLVFPEGLTTRALSKVNEKVRGSIDLSVDLLQAGQVARMANVLGRIRSFHLKRDWRSLLKSSASARLEYVYGWKPLASSLYGTLEETTNIVINKIQSVKAREFERIPSGPGNWTVAGFGSCPGVVERNGKYLCEIKLRFDTAGHNLDRLMSLSPASWAWELMPWSFVLDWIVDVGSYLRDLETSLLYHNSFVDGYVTKVLACDASWSGQGHYDDKSYPRNIYTCTATGSGKIVNLSRSKLLEYPLARLPSFKADLSSSRLLNLGALLAQKLGSKPAPSTRREKREQWKQSLPSW